MVNGCNVVPGTLKHEIITLQQQYLHKLIIHSLYTLSVDCSIGTCVNVNRPLIAGHVPIISRSSSIYFLNSPTKFLLQSFIS